MKISIVVPVYNEEAMISSCLDSLINQNYPKFEKKNKNLRGSPSKIIVDRIKKDFSN